MTGFVPVANHLWQSTLFAAIVALATLAFRRNRASVRHALWLAASVKFLVPFAALVALGGALGARTLSLSAHREVTVVLEIVSQPFSADTPALPPLPALPSGETPADRMAPIAAFVWLSGALAVLATSFVKWRRV